MEEPRMSKQDEHERALSLLLTPDFLATLIEAARTYGWSGDYVEVGQFVEWCLETAGQPVDRQMLEPYSYED